MSHQAPFVSAPSFFACHLVFHMSHQAPFVSAPSFFACHLVFHMSHQAPFVSAPSFFACHLVFHMSHQAPFVSAPLVPSYLRTPLHTWLVPKSQPFKMDSTSLLRPCSRG
jgi:hypothetical protein